MPLPRARAQVETRRGGHPQAQPSPCPPREAQTFQQGPGWLVPWLRSDKSHACTRGDTQHPEKPPDPTRNKTEKKETRNIKTLKRRKPSTHASRGAQGRDHRSNQSTGHHPRSSARDRLLCAVGCSESGPRAVAAGVRQVVQSARRASAARTLSCRRRALCTERLPERRKSTCHFLNCLQLVPLTRPGQAACARHGRRGAARPWLLVAGTGAVLAASRAPALSAAAAACGGRVCSARSRRWAGSGGVAARRRRG